MSQLRRFYDGLNEAAADCDSATQPDNLHWSGETVMSTASLDRTARVIPHAADAVVLEHYRRLRTKILQEREVRPFRTLMVASPNPGEGKTVTALNLALSFSMLPSWRVLLIDGDLRKGSIGKSLGVERQPGLSDLLQGNATTDEVIFKSDKVPMHFVLRGESDVSAAELLNSATVKTYFGEVANQFDLVLVDSPPMNLVTDAQLLARSCDAVLVVARAFSTSQKSLEKAVQDLHPVRILGAVLNGGIPMRRYKRYKGYY